MKTDGVTHFEMEMRHLLNTKIHGRLRAVYTDVEYHWGDYEVSIVTGDGYCKGIVINVHPNNYEVYKTGRKRGIDRIYHWFNKGLKSVGGDIHCDTEKEYIWLMDEVILPIQIAVDRMEEKNLTKIYMNEEEVRKITGSTQKSHRELVYAVKKLAQELNRLAGWDVEVQINEYFSYAHIQTGETMRMGVTGDYGDILYIFNVGSEKVNCIVENEEDSDMYDILDMVVKKTLKTRGFTKYDKGRLMSMIKGRENNG